MVTPSHLQVFPWSVGDLTADLSQGLAATILSIFKLWVDCWRDQYGPQFCSSSETFWCGHRGHLAEPLGTSWFLWLTRGLSSPHCAQGLRSSPLWRKGLDLAEFVDCRCCGATAFCSSSSSPDPVLIQPCWGRVRGSFGWGAHFLVGAGGRIREHWSLSQYLRCRRGSAKSHMCCQ